MALNLKQQATLEEFEDFIARPENTDKRFEYINGEIVEVSSNNYASKIAMLIGAAILFYLRDNDIGHVTGADGGYWVSGERYIPDVAYISYERQPELTGTGYNPAPPELAVEVISDPSNAEEQRRLRHKLIQYLASATIVWIVDPWDQHVEIYHPEQGNQELDETGTLTAADILPGFELAVKDIFPQKTGEIPE